MSKFPLPPKDSGLRTIVFDLDGTLAGAPNWPMPAIGELNPRVAEALEWYVRQGYEAVVHTSRPSWHASLVRAWLREHNIDQFVHDVVFGKPRAGLYIDDRAIRPEELTK